MWLTKAHTSQETPTSISWSGSRTDAVLTDSDLIARSNKYKSKPFSSNPKSNLIGIEFSKYLVKQWLSNAGNLDNVLTNKGHLKIVKYRINKLLSL